MRASEAIRRVKPTTPSSAATRVADQATRSVAIAGDNSAALLSLLKLEAALREADSQDVLQFLFANEAQKLTQSRQIFILRSSGQNQNVVAVSGLSAVDRNAPLIQSIETVIRGLKQHSSLHDVQLFDFATYTDESDPSFRTYPFRAMLWLPLLSRDQNLVGGILLTRELAWEDQQVVIGKRLAGAYAHAWSLLRAEAATLSRWSYRSFADRKLMLLVAGAVLATLMFPVSMTTLAPFEIVGREPFVVAAPIDGSIRTVLIDASAEVRAGQPLVQLADTVLRNRLDVAERETLVADARVKKATQLAFEDARGRQELGLAVAELALKTTERDFARDMLDQATIKATRKGVAVFSDKQSLIGKPVTVGERIMLIADPSQIEVAIDVNVNDAIALDTGARVKIFADADPLNSREAIVVAADYLARPRPGNTLAYRVTAKFADEKNNLPRLGTRGTAQLYGRTVALGFYLFRRPLSAARQWVGL